MKTGRGAVRSALAAVSAAVILAGCAGPSFTYEDYTLKAGHTAAETVSVTQTALLTARAAAQGRVTEAYADVVLTESESSAGDIADTFASVQPPDARADQLREELIGLLDEASDTLEKLRIEVRRGQLAGLADEAAPLQELGGKLKAFAEAHR